MDAVAPTLTPLAGGHSGMTFVGEVAGERAVVRLYPPDGPRGASAPEVDSAVVRLVRGLVPVPEVLEVRRPDQSTGAPGLLVSSWCAGERGDLAIGRLGDDEVAGLGAALGHVAGTLAGMPQVRAGLFSDGDLTLEPLPGGGLDEWVRARLEHWPRERLDRLVGVAVDAQDLLDTVGRCSLVHGDLNPKNVLVDPATLAVVAVVDWEFAHAGHPWTDLGNLLRFDRRAPWVDAVVAAWAGLRGGDPEELLEGARAADLWALVDLAARAGANPVADRAAVLLAAIADTGDLHAWPTA